MSGYGKEILNTVMYIYQASLIADKEPSLEVFGSHRGLKERMEAGMSNSLPEMLLPRAPGEPVGHCLGPLPEVPSGDLARTGEE